MDDGWTYPNTIIHIMDGFNDIMIESSLWGEEKRSGGDVLNLFVNGNVSINNCDKYINSIFVVGDILNCENADKIYHISPLESDKKVSQWLQREAQKSWVKYDDFLRGSRSTSGCNYNRSIMLLRVFSHLLSFYKNKTDEEFLTALRKMLEYATKKVSDESYRNNDSIDVNI